jgi:phosphotransferase system enzyme I (PtsI)
MPERKGETILSGIVAASGLVVGTIRVDRADRRGRRTVAAPAEEKAALQAALERARADVQRLIAGTDTLAAEILEFQEALLDDDDLLAPVFAAIDAGRPAHDAWADKLEAEMAEYRAGDDAYMAARAEDLRDLQQRVLRALAGDVPASPAAERVDDILVAEHLTPSRFVELDWRRLAGAVVRDGSPTSHVAILARARGVPLIVGLMAPLAEIADRSHAILEAEGGSGRAGRLVIAPAPATLHDAEKRIAESRRLAEAADAASQRPAFTAAGERVRVLANIDDPALLPTISAASVDGVGLTRTEFLFRDGRLPDEDAQLDVYRRIGKWADGKRVTIRTLDAGGDKPIAGVTPDGESNPFLGLRGLRLSLRNEPLFLTQLRALCRAAAEYPIRIMVPMVTLPSEFEAARALVKRACAQLARENRSHAEPTLGMMVEVPSAAIMADRFDADFYSIGSNDLVQYATAAARDNASVADLANPDNPAVFALIRMTVEAAARRRVDVSLCGDMASDPSLTAALLDCGLRSLSVAPPLIGHIKLAVARYPDRTAAA